MCLCDYLFKHHAVIYSVGKATDCVCIVEVRFSIEEGDFSVFTSRKAALESTQPPIKCVPGALSLGLSNPDMKLTVRLLLVPRVRKVDMYKGVSIIPETGTVICTAW
jgi:hypothetical protein